MFFAAAYFVALKPEKLTQRLGRILCPALLVLIVVLFAGCILRPAAPGYGTPAEAYAALPPHRACWTAIRPWTRWRRSASARSSR